MGAAEARVLGRSLARQDAALDAEDPLTVPRLSLSPEAAIDGWVAAARDAGDDDLIRTVEAHRAEVEAGWADGYRGEQGPPRRADAARIIARALNAERTRGLAGGTLVFDRRDGSGGAYYAASARPTLGPHDIRLPILDRRVTVREITARLGGSDEE
jgi:hypothetical protein